MHRMLRCSLVATRRCARGNATTVGKSVSVNADEVRKFSKVGSDWWRPDSASGTGPLHAMNPARVSFIRDSIAQKLDRTHLPASEQLKGLSILDVGCGGGLLAEALARLGANVTAIDPSKENISVASRHSSLDARTSSISYKCSTVEEILASIEKEEIKQFDVVCSLEVVEHVEAPLAFLKACRGCARQDGSLFFSTMNRTAKSYAMTILGAEYLLRLLPIGTHDWNKFITPEELLAMVSTTGPVKSTKCAGIVLDPRCILGGPISAPSPAWRLSDTDHDVNYIVHVALLI